LRRPGPVGVAPRCGRKIEAWYRSILASHRASRSALARRRLRKLELNPITPLQARAYRLLFCGAVCLFGLAIMGATA